MGGVELAICDLDFEAAARFEDVVELRLSGNADATIATQLTSLVGALHERLLATKTPELLVDIRALEFMNAACFNVFVTWVTRINELPPEQRYRLLFTTNPAIPWQSRSLRTLSCFATDVVQVEA